MSIYINKNNQQSGPYEEHVVIEQLRNGMLSPNDMGIRHGESAWQKLGDMFPDAVRKTTEPSPAVNAVGAGAPHASASVQAPAAKGGGCRGVAGILLMIFGVLALLGGGGMAIGTPFIYTTPSCEFAESDWKEIEDLKKKYDAAKDTYEETSVEYQLKSAMAAYETSSKHCDEQKSTMRMFQIGFGVAAFVGLLMIIVGFIVRRI
jgi:hypothetical protein